MEIWATDLSIAALDIARANAEQNEVAGRIHFLHGDTFDPVSDRQGFFHGIISNPPYVRGNEFTWFSREVLCEPRMALDGGMDGLDLYRVIIPNGHLYLQEEGFLTLEMGADMGVNLCQWINGIREYSNVSVHQDYSGRDRVLVTRKITSSGKSLKKG